MSNAIFPRTACNKLVVVERETNTTGNADLSSFLRKIGDECRSIVGTTFMQSSNIEDFGRHPLHVNIEATVRADNFRAHLKNNRISFKEENPHYNNPSLRTHFPTRRNREEVRIKVAHCLVGAS